MTPSHLLAIAAAAALAASGPAVAQCGVFDFEGFSTGTIGTSLIPGVTFTCPQQSCGPSNPLPEIQETVSGSGLTTKVIAPGPGCPGSSPDSLLMTFDENQSYIRFGLGSDVPGLEIRVRWYNEFGTPLGTRLYDSGSGADVIVTIEGAPIIRSVDVWQVNSAFELIDDLTFGQDTTPPSVEIDAPAFDTCVCGDAAVGIMGAVSDADGSYDCDVAEYRPIDAGTTVPWTTFGNACGAFTGTLHTLNTTSLSEGRYYVRITGTNSCGLAASDLTVVRVDRSFDTLGLTAVPDAVCGTVTVGGTVSDRCGVTWTLERQPAAGGAWVEIAAGSTNRNRTIADWDTATVPDGDYLVRLSATDSCGHADTTMETITIDNGACGCSADINGDGVVDFADILLVITQWG